MHGPGWLDTARLRLQVLRLEPVAVRHIVQDGFAIEQAHRENAALFPLERRGAPLPFDAWEVLPDPWFKETYTIDYIVPYIERNAFVRFARC